MGDNYCANFSSHSSVVVCLGYGFGWGAGGLTCDFAEGNHIRKAKVLKAKAMDGRFGCGVHTPGGKTPDLWRAYETQG